VGVDDDAVTRSAWVLLALIVARLVATLGFGVAALAAVAVWPSPWAFALAAASAMLLLAVIWLWWRVRQSLRANRTE
jgi:uncharacterized membrane protein YqjE